MHNPPLTRADAQRLRYGAWAGVPNGAAYRGGHCAFEVWSRGRGSMASQCGRRNGHGPDNLYCSQHAALVDSKCGTGEPKITMYQTASGYSRGEIKEVKVSRVTNCCVWLDGRRCEKRGGYEQYHETWDDARAFLSAGAKRALAHAESSLQSARAHLAAVEALRP